MNLQLTYLANHIIHPTGFRIIESEITLVNSTPWLPDRMCRVLTTHAPHNIIICTNTVSDFIITYTPSKKR